MRSSPSAPVETPLGSILNNWEVLRLDQTTKEQMIILCKIIWPIYRLENSVTWPINRSLSFNDISEVDLYCKTDIAQSHAQGIITNAMYLCQMFKDN